jgi:hypothetical protein
LPSENFFIAQSHQLGELSRRHRLPTIVGFRDSDTAGALIAPAQCWFAFLLGQMRARLRRSCTR